MNDLPRTLVLALGNPLLTDDGVALRVGERLRPLLAGRHARVACGRGGQGTVDLAEEACGGLRCMERLVGYDRAILIDAMYGGGGAPGSVQVLSPGDLPTCHSGSAHDADLLTALGLGRAAGAHLPEPANIRIVAITAADVCTFNEQCTPAVQTAVDEAAQQVLAILAGWGVAECGLRNADCGLRNAEWGMRNGD